VNWVSRFPYRTSSGTGALGITGFGFLWARCPSCHPTNSVKALKGTQSTDHNQWSDLILSSSTTGLLMEGTLLHLHRLRQQCQIIAYANDTRSRNRRQKIGAGFWRVCHTILVRNFSGIRFWSWIEQCSISRQNLATT